MTEFEFGDLSRTQELDALIRDTRAMLGELDALGPAPEEAPAPDQPPAPEPEPAPAAPAQPSAPAQTPAPDLDETRKYQAIQPQAPQTPARPAAPRPEKAAAKPEPAKKAAPARQPDRPQKAAPAPKQDKAEKAEKPEKPKKEKKARAEKPAKDAPAPQTAPAAPEGGEPAASAWQTKAPTGGIWTSTKVALYVLCVLVAAVLIAIGVWLAADDVLALTSVEHSGVVTIAPEDDISDVARKLKDEELIKYPALFRLYGKLFHAQNKIAPGEYTLNAVFDYRALVVGMMETYTAPETVTVTVPEGYSMQQIFQLLEDSGVTTRAALEDAAANFAFDYAFLQDIPLGDAARLEGYLFPDTYEFYQNDLPENVLMKFLSNFSGKFTADMLQQLDELNERLAQLADERGGQAPVLTQRDVIAVASMIEREASVSAERTTIASVIYNRLTDPHYDLLQIDATVYYALGRWDTALTFEDLEIDSPYNTYLYPGLPAGPICNPGVNCLKAALYPSDTEYYYYALNIDGTHHFSLNSAEHEAFLASLED